MPVYTRNPYWQRGDQIQPESTGSEVAGAMFSEAAVSGPFGAIGRILEIEQEEGWRPFGADPGKLSPLLTPEQAREALRNAGLSESLSVPEGGIRQATLDTLMERKREELRRQQIMATAPPGMATLGASLIGGFAGTLVDPTNIALAFVPVVGEARYAQLLARAGGMVGRTGIRVGVGAAEGIVGAAIVEPLNYVANLQQQADYDAYDSMVNIAGGAFFGAALHGGAGFAGDLLMPGRWQVAPAPRAAPETGAAGRTAASLPATDRLALEREYVLARLAEGQPVTRRQMEAMTPRDGLEASAVIDGRLAELDAMTANLRTPEQITALTKEADELEALVRSQDAAKKAGVLPSPENRLTPTERHVADQRRAFIKQELEQHRAAVTAGKEAGDLRAKLAKVDRDADLIALADKVNPRRAEAERFVESLPSAIRKALDDDPFLPMRPFVAQMLPETQASALRMAIAQAVDGRPVDVMPAVFGDPRSFDRNGMVDSALRNAKQTDFADDAASKQADAADVDNGEPEELDALFAEEKRLVDKLYAAAGREMDNADLRAIDEQATLRSAAADKATECLLGGGL